MMDCWKSREGAEPGFISSDLVQLCSSIRRHCYETPDGAVQEIEAYVDEGGVASYLPHRVYPADNIEVHDLTKSQA